ncbi:hypothetical protein RyT2_23680 [Pseudolactococcus yaeyamensis]
MQLPLLVTMSDYNIFNLKPFIEPSSIENSIWGGLTFVFVTVPFWILKIVAFVFYWIIKVVGMLSPYETFKSSVFTTSKDLFDKMRGGSGSIATTSVIGFFIALTLIYLTYAYIRGQHFGQKVVHVLAVYALGLTFFGTITDPTTNQSVNGGIYILDTVHNLSKEITTKISSVSVTNADGTATTSDKESSFANAYLNSTIYETYRYINSGSTSATVKGDKDKEDDEKDSELKFDDTKVGVIKDSQVSKKEIDKYLDGQGQGADKGVVKNVWVSAVGDYIIPKACFVWFKIVDAVVIGIPVLVIELISIAVEFLVLLIMFMIPIGFLVSFIPSMQQVLFNMFKTSFAFLLLPSIASFALLIFFYFNSMIGNSFVNLGSDIAKEGMIIGAFATLISLIVALIVKIGIYFGIWKFKGTLGKFLFGSNIGNKLPINNVTGSIMGENGDIANKIDMVKTLVPAITGAVAPVAKGAVGGVGAPIIAPMLIGKQLLHFMNKSKVSPQDNQGNEQPESFDDKIEEPDDSFEETLEENETNRPDTKPTVAEDLEDMPEVPEFGSSLDDENKPTNPEEKIPDFEDTSNSEKWGNDIFKSAPNDSDIFNSEPSDNLFFKNFNQLDGVIEDYSETKEAEKDFLKELDESR